MPETNACQLVLKYLMLNRSQFVKAFHNRVYSFSSGTKFTTVCVPLFKWRDDLQDEIKEFYKRRDKGEDNGVSVLPLSDPHPSTLTATFLQGEKPPDPIKALKRLSNERGLYQKIGDAIIEFMKVKPEPYLSKALASKANFWMVPPWKRAMTFVFMLRFLLGFNAHHQWRKFTVLDYKLNKRSFARWLQKEDEIFAESTKLEDLVDSLPPVSPARRHKRRLLAVSDSTDSPMKRKFVVADVSTDDE